MSSYAAGTNDTNVGCKKPLLSLTSKKPNVAVKPAICHGDCHSKHQTCGMLAPKPLFQSEFLTLRLAHWDRRSIRASQNCRVPRQPQHKDHLLIATKRVER